MSLRWTEEQLADFQQRNKAFDGIAESHGLTPKPSKYRAQKVTIDGITFDSKKEGARYCQLKSMEKAGQISNLTLQPSFDLAPAITIRGKKKPPLRYVADFQYMENDRSVTEDCKGMITDVYKIKRHLMMTVHGIEIKET